MDDRLNPPDRTDILRRMRERDPSLWSEDAEVRARIANRLGWLNLPESMAAQCEALSDFARSVRQKGYTNVVLLGMGGSSLAPAVFRQTFVSTPGYPRLTVLDTTDPAAIIATARAADPDKTLFIVSSKSGTTIETVSLYRYFSQRVRSARRGKPLSSFVAITDPGTPLAELASEEGFLHCFVNPPDVGGRYSALSYFGLAPAAAIGLDVSRLLHRARGLDPAAGVDLGTALAGHALAGRDKVTFAGFAGLGGFGAWAEQLLAESTGKDGRGLIPVDGEPIGPADAYGDDRVFVRLQLRDGADGLDDDARAMETAGHPVITIDCGDRYDLGAEFVRWEIATAAAGAVLGINPFDEPNVQESKDNTALMLEEYLESGRLPGHPSLAPSDGAFVATHFRDGRPGDYGALLAYIEPLPEHGALLTRLRVAIRDATGLATTVGFGPRYLHSTGQLHKGGPGTGVFLVLTADDAEDAPIPGERYGFSTLKRAQALGDLRALDAKGRRVAHVDLGHNAAAGLRRLLRGVEAALEPRAQVATE